MARSDGNYFVIRGYMDGEIMGERSFDTQQEAEFYGKRMLDAIKSQNPKAKKIVVDIDSTVKHAPGPKIKTLASRPGAKDTMASEGDAIASVLNKYAPNEDGSWVLNGDDLFVYDSAAKERITKVLRQAMSKGLIRKMPKFILNKFSRPGAKATFKVEDRFYFGKGRKDRFAEKNDGWALQSVNVPDWGTHHFPSEAAARKYAVEKGYNYEMRLLHNGKTVAIKRWDNTWSNR